MISAHHITDEWESVAMTNSLTTTQVPHPAAVEPDIWQDDVSAPYRVLYGGSRGMEGRDDVEHHVPGSSTTMPRASCARH